MAKCVGYEALTVSTAAVGATSVPSMATNQVSYMVMTIVVEGAKVRFRDDGTNPTSTVGTPLPDGTAMTFYGDPDLIKFIRDSAASSNATVHIRFEGE